MRSKETMKKAENFEKDVNDLMRQIDITHINKEEGMFIGIINQNIDLLKCMAETMAELEKHMDKLEKKND